MAILQLPNLDESVLAALRHFSGEAPTRFRPESFSFPLVIGSGNAYNTGLIIFGKQPAVITNESGCREVAAAYHPLMKAGRMKDAVVISASGEKDSIWEIGLAKKLGLKTTLLTCNGSSTSAQLADKTLIYAKLPEPYTYNTSTYLGMLLGSSGENPASIVRFIKRLRLPDFRSYSAYAFILPDEYAAIAPMLEIKRHELFGPYVSLRAFSAGEARHAKFVHPWEKELVISLAPNKLFGKPKSRWETKLPSGAGVALVMALCYYLIGKIQASKPPYFRNHIKAYCQEGPKAYGQKKPFDIIVK